MGAGSTRDVRDNLSSGTILYGPAPMVSIIVPCRNENDRIESCMRSILAQTCSVGGFEVIVVDGLSTDGTRAILTNLAEGDPRLRIVDNPSQTTPYAINIGIRAARGRYVAILGAHTEYAPSYLQACLELLQEHQEVCCVGGPIISQGKGRFGRAVAAVMSHPVGVGNAKHRLPDYEGYAEGACYPMFRKEVFEKVGLYDESFIRNQDDEFNYRLALHGEKIFISPRARCTYFVRETPSRLFQQYFQYGFWRVAVLRKHRLPASFRQIVPPAFMWLTLAALIVGSSLPGWWRLTAVVLPLVYGSTLLSAATGVAYKRGWMIGLLFPLAAAVMHAAYAAGFTWGALKSGKRLVKKVSCSSDGECHASRI